MPATTLSIKAYAKHRGVTRHAVQQAIAAGRIRKLPDGTIDPTAADLEWSASTAPRMAPRSKTKSATEEPADLPGDVHAVFHRARAEKMVEEAKREALELKIREGTLLERAAVTREVFAFGARVREQWQGWPSRIAPELAATLGVNPVVLVTSLEDAVRRQLESFSDDLITLPLPADSARGAVASPSGPKPRGTRKPGTVKKRCPRGRRAA